MDTPTCNISKGTDEAEVLKHAELIVWDECTMAHKLALEALNLMLQDIRDNTKRFGGVTLLLAGDFRQTLPVIPRSTPADEVSACLKSSYLWRPSSGLQVLKLSTNMRVHLHQDPKAEDFSKLLLSVGNGAIPALPDGDIIVPSSLGQMVPHLNDLKSKVYPDLTTNYTSKEWLCERAILAPRNDMVRDINTSLLSQLPGEEFLYQSVDSVIEDDDAVNYPTEFLNSLDPPGMPTHNL